MKIIGTETVTEPSNFRTNMKDTGGNPMHTFFCQDLATGLRFTSAQYNVHVAVREVYLNIWNDHRGSNFLVHPVTFAQLNELLQHFRIMHQASGWLSLAMLDPHPEGSLLFTYERNIYEPATDTHLRQAVEAYRQQHPLADAAEFQKKAEAFWKA